MVICSFYSEWLKVWFHALYLSSINILIRPILLFQCILRRLCKHLISFFYFSSYLLVHIASILFCSVLSCFLLYNMLFFIILSYCSLFIHIPFLHYSFPLSICFIFFIPLPFYFAFFLLCRSVSFFSLAHSILLFVTFRGEDCVGGLLGWIFLCDGQLSQLENGTYSLLYSTSLYLFVLIILSIINFLVLQFDHIILSVSLLI